MTPWHSTHCRAAAADRLALIDDRISGDRHAPTVRWVARAPARLELAGGIADCTGGEVAATPLADGYFATVSLRDDADFEFVGVGPDGADNVETVVVERSALSGLTPDQLIRSLPAVRLLLPAIGAVHALFAAGKTGTENLGAKIIVCPTTPPHTDLGAGAAIAVPVIMTLLDAWGVRFDPIECALMAMRAESAFLGHPCGTGEALAALHARPGQIAILDCFRNMPIDSIVIPGGAALLGIDCGRKCADAGDKYRRARTAALMGKSIVEHLNAASNGFALSWDGSLAHVAPADFVAHLKNRIPKRMKGADFIKRFGALHEPFASVEPAEAYNIRSRTEHHIYEPQRVRTLAKHLTHAGQSGDRSHLVAAGTEIYGSNWSYSQRCGLGSVETERLITALRERGESRGVLGAKGSGQGSGGIVVVLIENTVAARAAVDEATRDYERLTSLQTKVFEGTSPGALAFGVHRFEDGARA